MSDMLIPVSNNNHKPSLPFIINKQPTSRYVPMKPTNYTKDLYRTVKETTEGRSEKEAILNRTAKDRIYFAETSKKKPVISNRVKTE